jgi:hypothetical protein
MSRAIALLAACVLAIAPARPSRAAAADRASEQREEARRHFRLGVGLFQIGDHAAALTEFEASQRHFPSAQALQNIALCLTRLHRYVRALETLETLEAEHGAALSATDRKAVGDSIRELSNVVGTLTLNVVPPSAQVFVNDRPIPAEALAKPLRLSSGEYRISARARAHQQASQSVVIAGGEQVRVDLYLEPDAGEVTVRPAEPGAYIAVDGRMLARGLWRGSLAAGSHRIEVSKNGYEAYVTQITLEPGERVEIRPSLGPLMPGTAAPGPAAARDSSTPGRAPRGWYGLFTATDLLVLGHPDGFARASGADATGGSYGFRAGYRFWQNVAFEGLFDMGKQTVGPGTWADPASRTSLETSYDLSTRRFGGNVRLLAGGRAARLSSVFGVGAAHHVIDLGPVHAEGSNGFFLFELGAQFNVGHVLLEVAALAMAEGTTGLRVGDRRLYTDHTVVPQLGLGFRAGLGEWGQW